jgi:hypothetical protein
MGIRVSQTDLNVRDSALVDMSAIEGAKRLAVAFNRSRTGTTVLLLSQPRLAN